MLKDPFHRHLDDCDQCGEHPFNLCKIGSRLLEECSQDAASALGVKLDVPQKPEGERKPR